MDCVFIRHGEASHRAASDSQRPLTERGQWQVESAAEWLCAQWHPQRILASPYLRAQQTADAFSAVYPAVPRDNNADFLTPDTPLTALTEALSAFGEERVLLVGHNPLFSDLLPWFCGERVSGVMAPASMALIQLPVVARDIGTLYWLRHAPDFDVNVGG